MATQGPLYDARPTWDGAAFADYADEASLAAWFDALSREAEALPGIFRGPLSTPEKTVALITFLENVDFLGSQLGWTRGAVESLVTVFRPLTYSPSAHMALNDRLAELNSAFAHLCSRVASAGIPGEVQTELRGTAYESRMRDLLSQALSANMLASVSSAFALQREIVHRSATLTPDSPPEAVVEALRAGLDMRRHILEFENKPDMAAFFARQAGVPPQTVEAVFEAARSQAPALLEAFDTLKEHPAGAELRSLPRLTYQDACMLVWEACANMPLPFRYALREALQERWIMVLNAAHFLNPDVIADEHQEKARDAFIIRWGFDPETGEPCGQEARVAMASAFPDYEAYLFEPDAPDLTLHSKAIPGKPGGHPFVLITNWRGRAEDLFMLIHELFHAVAIHLANRSGCASSENMPSHLLHEFFAAFGEFLMLEHLREIAGPMHKAATLSHIISLDLSRLVDYALPSDMEHRVVARYLEAHRQGRAAEFLADSEALLALYAELRAAYGMKHEELPPTSESLQQAARELLSNEVNQRLSYTLSRMAMRSLLTEGPLAERKGEALLGLMQEGAHVNFGDAMQRLGVTLDTPSFERGMATLLDDMATCGQLLDGLAPPEPVKTAFRGG